MQYAVGSRQNSGSLRGHVCLLLTAYCLLLIGCSSGPSAPDTGSYVERLTSARAFKDQDFRTSAQSPEPAEKRDALLPLKYYPIDPA